MINVLFARRSGGAGPLHAWRTAVCRQREHLWRTPGHYLSSPRELENLESVGPESRGIEAPAEKLMLLRLLGT